MKPHNVLMAGSVPRVTDFGIGSVVMQPSDDPATGAQTAYAARLPSALHAAGTALYAPPEQRFGSPPDPRDDVYALGIMAFQMVRADLTAVPGADATLELRDLRVPGELVALIVTSIAMNADRRPKDASEWEARLAALLQKAQKQPGPTDTSVTGSKPVLLPEPESSDRSAGQPPRFPADDFKAPSPEPTAGLPFRTGPPPLPPPLPVALELPPEPPPKPRPVARHVREPVRPESEPKWPSRQQGLALVLGSVLILSLAFAIVIAAIPPGKRAEPTGTAARVENPKNEPKGGAPKTSGGGTKGAPEPNTDPKGGVPDQKSGGMKGGRPEPKKDQEAVPKQPEPEQKVILPKAGDTREIEIAPGVNMTFCWVPKGECQLGSPKDEQDYVTKTFFEGKRPAHLDSETETARGKFQTDGFWMGKHTVTQAEWKGVMGNNPSYFDGTKDNKAKGMDTRRLPVESVNWDRICGKGKYVGEGFLNTITHGGIQKALGKAGKFRLPKESEWEYAARVGRGNEQPFYWGKELNGTQANCDGNSPYGGVPKGTALGRTCAVDATEDTMGHKYATHPWGLMHMHGNVWQWCEDYYDATNVTHVLRGGQWFGFAHHCRAAYRGYGAPSLDSYGVGFRLVVSSFP